MACAPRRTRVEAAVGSSVIECLCRSSVESEKRDLAVTVRFALENAGAAVAVDSDFPGWAPRLDWTIVTLMKRVYRDLFGSEPRVSACHAGLECGIISDKYPYMELISFGPTICGAHSPDEKVEIRSVHKFWTLLLATLERIPKKVG